MVKNVNEIRFGPEKLSIMQSHDDLQGCSNEADHSELKSSKTLSEISSINGVKRVLTLLIDESSDNKVFKLFNSLQLAS